MSQSTISSTSTVIRITWLGQAGFSFTTREGKRIYLDPYLSDACERLFGFKRLSLPAINGVFGNMNHIDAARLVSEAKPRFAIPCHFWTLAEQGAGDPAGFIHACAVMCPEVRAVLLKPGEIFSVEPQDCKLENRQ